MVTVSGNSNLTNPTTVNSGELTDKNPLCFYSVSDERRFYLIGQFDNVLWSVDMLFRVMVSILQGFTSVF